MTYTFIVCSLDCGSSLAPLPLFKPANLFHCVLSHRLQCVSVSTPSPGQGPCLAFPSELPAVQPRAVWTVPAGSADCSQTALCTETNNTGVTQA